MVERVRKPNYWKCKHIVKELQRFQDLIRHHQRWAHQMDFARPWEELFPDVDEKDPKSRGILEREISRMAPIVHTDLNTVNVETRFTVTESEDKPNDEGILRLV